jgi:hypothetical protein
MASRRYGPSLEERIRAGAEERLVLHRAESSNERRELVQEHGLVVQEALRFDPYRTAILGASDEMEALAREDEGWISAAGGDEYLVEIIADWERLWRHLALLYVRDPIAKNIINNYTLFTVGRGFSVTFKDEAAQAKFDLWARRVKFWSWVRRMVRTTYLFGECYTVRFPAKQGKVDVEALRNRNGSSDAEPGEKIMGVGGTGGAEKATTFRLWEPRKIGNLLRSRNDSETVLAYAVAGKTYGYRPEYVIHHRLEGAGSAARGIPLLSPAIVDLKRLDKFAENRYWVNHTRARVPLIRSAPAGGHVAKLTGDPKFKVIPPPGTLAIEQEGWEWKFPAYNIDSQGVVEDRRTWVLRVAAAVSLPEFLVLMDVSNAPYTATLVADGPLDVMFSALQEEFIPQIEELLFWFAGEFGSEEFVVDPSSLIRREFNKDAEAWGNLVERRIASVKTAQAKLGLDPAQEQASLEEERMTRLSMRPEMVAGLLPAPGAPPAPVPAGA